MDKAEKTYGICREDETVSKNNYWVLLLKGEEPEIFTSWTECEKKSAVLRGLSIMGFAPKKR